VANQTGQGVAIPELNRQSPEITGAPAVSFGTTPKADLSSWGKSFGELADTLHGVSARINQRLDRIAQDQGEAAGTVQGATGDVPLAMDGTIRGEAFDAAATRAMLANHDNLARAATEQIYLQNKDNPGALQAKLKAYRDGVMSSSMPDPVKAEFGLSYDRMTQPYISDAAQRQESLTISADQAAATQNIDQRRKTIEHIQLFTQNDAKAAVDTAAEIKSLQDFAIAHGPKGAFTFNGVQYPADARRGGAYTLEQIQSLMQETTDHAKEKRVLGKFLQADSSVGPYGPQAPLQAQQNVYKAFEQEFKTGNSGFTLEQYDRLASSMRADINRKEADQRGAVEAVTRGLAQANSMIESGYNPGPDMVAALSARASATGDAAAIGEASQVKNLMAFQDEARTLRPDQLQGWLNSEQARLAPGASPFEAKRAELGQKLLNNMNTELQRDPLSWASRVGLVKGAPLTLTDPSSFQQRLKDAATVSAHYGVDPPLMTAEEASSWKNSWDAATPDAKVAMVAALQHGFGTDAPFAFQSLAKSSPGLANVGGLLASSQAHMDTVRDYAIGDAALVAKENPLPDHAQLEDRRAATLGDAYGFSPGAAQGVNETADRLYAARALRQGKTNKDFDQDLYDDCLKEASGGWKDKAGDWHGGIDTQKSNHMFVLPPNMTRDQFDSLTKQLTPEALQVASVGGKAPRYAGGQVMTPDELRDGFLISSGPGRYLVSTVNPRKKGQPVYLQGGNKQGLYEIDLNKLAPTTAAGLAGFDANSAPGMLQQGTIKNLYDRPILKNADGSVSTTRSMSIGIGGKEVLIPTVVDGKSLSNDEAVAHFKKTGEHLGVFDTPEHADAYATALHNEQARRMGLGGGN
jgi:hypothetical protein